MSGELDEDDAERYVGGDCGPFVQVCPDGIRALAKAHGFVAAERAALLVLVLEADYRTGIIEPITLDGVGELLGCSKPTARKRIDALREAGVLAADFPTGHAGWVAVTSYLEVVRVIPSRATAIHDAMLARQARSRAAAERRAARHARSLSSGSPDVSEPTSGSLGYNLAERPGRTTDPSDGGSGEAPYASTAEVGSRSRWSTSRRRCEATRVTRETACPWAPTEVLVPLPSVPHQRLTLRSIERLRQAFGDVRVVSDGSPP